MFLEVVGFEAGDFNFYRYVGNDPVNFVDPSGLEFTIRDGAGFVPVLGSALDSYDEFKCGNIGMGLLNLGLALIDLTGVGAIAKGLTVGTMKYAARKQIRKAYKETSNWNSMRGRLQRSGIIEKNSMSTPRRDWITTDHIFIKQRHGLPHWITNHPANLQTGVPLRLNQDFERMNAIQRAKHLPTWMKAGGAGVGSYGAGQAINPEPSACDSECK